MLNSAALVSVMKVVMMMLMILGTGVEAAPSERGFVKPPHPLPSLTHASAAPEKSSALNPSQYLKHWLLSTKAAGVDGTTRISDKTTTRTITAGIRTGANTETARPDRRAQMLKMISALEELHRTFNSTLSSRLTIMPRANGRNSGRKNKVPPAAEGGVKPTTVAPASVDSTATRPSADVIVPSLTGRNFKKSLPPQTKKTNKRVCFWKYCSQN
ncbi:urotensin II-related peptide [Siniperca chuatsi]|uniref:urotensin II-related peptide n=1 Tax=Siniperca chuatsi TaxID=119488 RepID=UPI001CE19602|nr:urotensin II-related peptide [Siniperca chuatsi]XP_044044476.1 urotensin II-related peptide [Siniperca chuatsi]